MATYSYNNEPTTITMSEGISVQPGSTFYSGQYVLQGSTFRPNFNYPKVTQDKMKITDVRIIVPGKVVEVKFADGLKEKVVCQEPDVFSLESAISICIAKHASGGHKAYHKAIKDAFKVYDEKLKKEAADAALKEKIKERKAKKIAQKEKRKQKADEHQIKIQKEAYVRAIKEIEMINMEQIAEEYEKLRINKASREACIEQICTHVDTDECSDVCDGCKYDFCKFCESYHDGTC